MTTRPSRRNPVLLGLLARFRADRVVATSGSVDSWPQSGGSIASAPSSTLTLRPTVAIVAGRAAVSFAAASSQKLFETSSTLAAALGGVSPYTVYCSCLRTDPGPGTNGVICGWATAATDSNVIHGSNGSRDQYTRVEATATTNNITASTTAWPLTRFAYASTFNGAAIRTLINGRLIQTGANTRNVGASSIMALGAYVLGAGSYGGYLDGQITELLFYAGSHDVVQMEDMTRWLMANPGY